MVTQTQMNNTMAFFRMHFHHTINWEFIHTDWPAKVNAKTMCALCDDRFHVRFHLVWMNPKFLDGNDQWMSNSGNHDTTKHHKYWENITELLTNQARTVHWNRTPERTQNKRHRVQSQWVCLYSTEVTSTSSFNFERKPFSLCWIAARGKWCWSKNIVISRVMDL